MSSETYRWIIGITGASGSIYGVTLTHYLLQHNYTVHLVITDAGWRVLHDELGWNTTKRSETINEQFGDYESTFKFHPIQDIGASIASGSYRVDGMVIVPCSMGSVAAVANGSSNNLLQRAADVMLKEGRKLIIVPRETPLSAIHLENMLKLARLGVTIAPAMPAFYHKPGNIEDMVNFMVGKTLDSMGIHNQVYSRWGAEDDRSTKNS
ncbi:MAG: flavin prenyltransferase UbiX [Paenibacillaceae bacterium]